MTTNNIMPKILYPISGGYVNSLTPTIQGTGCPGAEISGQLDQTPFCVRVSENGTWNYTASSPLGNLTCHTIRLTQTEQGGKVSPSVSAEFKTDTNMLLKHTVTSPSNNQYINTNTPELSGTGKPGAAIEAVVCNKTYTGIVNTERQWHIKTAPLPDGIASAAVIQKDQGNTGDTIQLAFTVDTAAPGAVTLNSPSDQGFINNPKPVISGTGEPDAVVSAIVDDKEYATTVNKRGSWSVEIAQALLDDTHIISAKQKDKAGNISAENVSLFTVKTKQPGVPSVTSPNNGSIVATALPVLTGTGEYGCRVEVKTSGKTFNAEVKPDGSWEIRISQKLNDGAHTFQIYQIDQAGNYSPNTDLTINIDTTVPAAPVILYPENNGYVTSPSFQVKGTGEPDATVQCDIAGVDYSVRVENDGSWTIQVANNDNIKYQIAYTISAKQIDPAGNTSTCARVNFKVDTECLKAPEITFPQCGATLNTMNPVISGKGKPGATVDLTLNNETFTASVASNGTWSINIGKNLAQGQYKATVCQTDAGNKSESRTIDFTIKVTAPAAPQIICPMENQTVTDPSVILKGTGEGGNSIDILLDDACYTAVVQDDGSWEYTLEKLENGRHSMLVSQTDAAGNKSACAPVNFIYSGVRTSGITNQQPVCYEIRYNPPGPAWTREAIATLKTSQPITVSGVGGTVFSMILTSNGVYNFDFTDNRGNSGTVSAAVTWIDSKPPVLNIESSGSYFTSDKIVNYFTPCGAPVRYALINGCPFPSGTTVTSEGAYRAEVCDQAGNIAAEQFFIDRTPPTVMGIENNKTYRSDVTINFCDSVSGIKSAMLNGDNILPGSVVTQNGDYTLTLTDNGDNQVVVRFKLQK
jgi:hypothetical protein